MPTTKTIAQLNSHANLLNHLADSAKWKWILAAGTKRAKALHEEYRDLAAMAFDAETAVGRAELFEMRAAGL